MADLFRGSSNVTVKWEPEPQLRGTFTILSTCIITLALCVWNSVHLNLPAVGKKSKGRGRRIAWIFLGLFAPEVLIFTAQIQRSKAKKIQKEVEKVLGPRTSSKEDPENLKSTRQNPWTMTHSFWAIMGGIATAPPTSDSFIPRSAVSTLTTNGILLLLKHEPDLLPDISEDEVKDKSKGDSVTKFLACVQATWFCLSCISRVAQRLPVSMLELNAFAHALCTLAVYIFWWKKPLDIRKPYVIRDERMDLLLAYMWMSSTTSCLPKPKADSTRTITIGGDPEFEAIIEDSTQCEVSELKILKMKSTIQPRPEPAANAPKDVLKATIDVTTTKSLEGTNFKVNGESTRWKTTTTKGSGDELSNSIYTYVSYAIPIFHLTPSDARRWKFAKSAMDKYHLTKPDKNLDLITLKAIEEVMNEDDISCVWAFPVLALVTACYGGLHAIAWNAYFPTPREQKLWRISSLVIAVPGLLLLAGLSLFGLLLSLIFVAKFIRLPILKSISRQTGVISPNAQMANTTNSVWRVIGGGLLALFSGAMICLYFPARGYLVYESFRTVFFLPPEAFHATTWTRYLPHIT